jgi:hypothetical protein
MKRRTIIAAVIGLLVLLIAGVTCWPTIRFVYSMSTQMKAGQRTMDSLTEADIPLWVNRTEELLAKFDPRAETIGTYGPGGKPIPADLQLLKILRVDIYDSNTVGYVWLGGMDHTYLVIQRASGSNFTFTAHYNDKTNRVIWPKN